jgi:hypothetical protein
MSRSRHEKVRSGQWAICSAARRWEDYNARSSHQVKKLSARFSGQTYEGELTAFRREHDIRCTAQTGACKLTF